jgi:phosphoribosylaminoimidazole (AIR) synthetase
MPSPPVNGVQRPQAGEAADAAEHPPVVGGLDRGAWTPPPIFRLLGALGPVDDEELAGATNLGVGMVLVLPAAEAGRAAAFLDARGLPAWVIGEVEAAA